MSVLLLATLVGLPVLVAGCAKAPVAGLATDKARVAVGEVVRFTDESSGDIDSWSWKFGDGYVSTEQNPSYTYTEGGDYTVSLTVSNEAGSDTATLVVTVLEPPIADFSTSPTRAKVSESIQFTDESSGDIDSWFWDFGDGDTSTEQNPSHTYTDLEMLNYTVSLTVSNEAGSDSAIQVITVLIPPICTFSASPTKAGLETPIQFTDESGFDIDSWLWDFGDGSSSAEQNPWHTYEKPGTYTVTLTVNNPVGSDTRMMKDYITVTPLLVSHAEICSAFTEQDGPTPRPDATFHIGDEVWIYFEVTGFEQRKTDGEYEIWLDWTSVDIKGPYGYAISSSPAIERPETVSTWQSMRSFYTMLGTVASEFYQHGKYTVKVIVKDNISGAEASRVLTFFVE